MSGESCFRHVARRLALVPVLLMAPLAALAAIVEYTITFDGVIHNPNGSWGGDLPVAAERHANLSLIYQYLRAEDGASRLYTIQLVDHTRGRASARLFARSTTLTVAYGRRGAADRFTDARGNRPGGAVVPEATGEFGELGDPLPSGPAFDANVNANLMEVVYALAAVPGDEVSWQQRQPGTFEFSSRALPDPALDLLHCVGDVNGDAVPDLVAAALDGRVTVTGVDGRSINSFSVAVGKELVDLELIPDTNGNGAPELVALRRGSNLAEVHDLLTSALLATVAFNRDIAPVDMEPVPDRNANGIPELALLGFEPATRERRSLISWVEVTDALTGRRIIRQPFLGWSVPQDLDVQADSDGNGLPELVILSDHLNRRGADDIRISDTERNEPRLLRRIWLGRIFTALRQVRLGDINGNGHDELAVLRVEAARSVSVQIRDSRTREWLGFVGFNGHYPPERLVAIADINGNGAGELVMFGRRYDGSDQKAVIKDSRTGSKLSQVWFDSAFHGQAFTACGDLNGNGAEDLAMLGERPGDGRRAVIVKDSRTGARLARVNL